MLRVELADRSADFATVGTLGQPPRRLVMLYLDGSDAVLPSRGDDVVLGEKTVGHVTSVARHYELGPVALAVIKRGTDPTAELLVLTGDKPGRASHAGSDRTAGRWRLSHCSATAAARLGCSSVHVTSARTGREGPAS